MFTFSAEQAEVAVYDSFEVTIADDAPDAQCNPFTEVQVVGEFQRLGGERIVVDGFCDAQDGSLYKVRFMPKAADLDYRYRVTVRKRGAVTATYEGTFRVVDQGRRGLVQINPRYPRHFNWQGTGEPYFWNGTTTYALAGCDDATIEASLDRLARLNINRIRVGVSSARVPDARAWYEEVYPDEHFTFLTNPWLAERPEWLDPGWDVTRFNVAYWQKFDRLVQHAHKLNIVVSVVFYVDGRRAGVYPFGGAPGGADEMRFYRYAAARLAAYANVMWDVTNEWRLFRDEMWVNKMALHLRECDPYGHLMSVHGHEDFPPSFWGWADFALYQLWDEHGGNSEMLRRRGTILDKPVINEEYGYEDHYPQGWGGARVWPARTADNRRRLAWEICMAGCYQTTGERANVPGQGGWVNGRGNDSMTMLEGYGHMAEFFTSFEWFRCEPHNELVSGWNLCLAIPGELYAVYLPAGGAVRVKAEPGRYGMMWANPRDGLWSVGLGFYHADDNGLEVDPTPDNEGDWALLLDRA